MLYNKKKQESVQKRKTFFEIAFHWTLNFLNKFKNNFKPNDRKFKNGFAFLKPATVSKKFCRAYLKLHSTETSYMQL